MELPFTVWYDRERSLVGVILAAEKEGVGKIILGFSGNLSHYFVDLAIKLVGALLCNIIFPFHFFVWT